MTQNEQMLTAGRTNSSNGGLSKVLKQISLTWDMRSDRRQSWDQAKENCRSIHTWLSRYLTLNQRHYQKLAEELGLWLQDTGLRSIERDRRGRPKVEVHTARPAWRVRKNGSLGLDLVIELTQRRAGYFDEDQQKQADAGRPSRPADFWLRGGCTLLVDAGSGDIRYAVRKNIRSQYRLARQRQFLQSPPGMTLAATYFRTDWAAEGDGGEPFAMLHAELE